MAKNRKFYLTYTIEFEGITTNNFMIDFIDDVLRIFIKTMNAQHKQIVARITQREEKI